MNLTNYKYEGNEIKNLSNNNEYQNLKSPSLILLGKLILDVMKF